MLMRWLGALLMHCEKRYETQKQITGGLRSAELMFGAVSGKRLICCAWRVWMLTPQRGAALNAFQPRPVEAVA